MAKIDPYLRPLYDALYDMIDTDGAQKLLERGVVEVAPLRLCVVEPQQFVHHS